MQTGSYRKYLYIALALVILRLWIQPLSSSLWLDETGTFWIVQGTFAQMAERTARWVGQPPFYATIVWFFAQLPGPREVVLRLPSLIGLFVAAVFVYRIGKRLLGAESAWASTLIFCAISATHASDARPYALGLMTATGAVFFLLRWMENGKSADAIAYAVLASLTVYFHLLFSVMFLVHLVYFAVRIHQGKRPRLLSLLACGVILVCMLGPELMRALQVSSARGSLVFMDSPRPSALFRDSVPPFFYACLVIALLAAVLLRSCTKFLVPQIPKPELWLLALWAIVPPVIIFFVSYLTPVKLFLPRYFAVCLPGLALLTAYIISGFEPVMVRGILVLALAAGAVIDRGGKPWKLAHDTDNWRDGLAAVKSMLENNAMPVLVRSGFVEAATPAILHDPAKSEFLMAPLVAYPISVEPIPLPYSADSGAIEHLESIIGSTLLSNDRFLLVSGRGETAYRQWLDGRLYPASFRSRDIGNFGSVSVVLFERK
jgi:4-amino-4-deoxy-L-arabinose transferase-like glycosyltransferase